MAAELSVCSMTQDVQACFERRPVVGMAAFADFVTWSR